MKTENLECKNLNMQNN